MKKIDEQIKRIKELISEETLYGRKIDLIMETPLPGKLKNLVLSLDDTFGKLSEHNPNKFIKNFNAYEWANKVTENLKKLKDLPASNTNPKISDVNKILSENKKIMDDINKYFSELELDRNHLTPENTKLFNDISKSLPNISNNIGETKRLLMLPSNKLTDANKKFISEMTGYSDDTIIKLLSTISDTIKHLSNGFYTIKKILFATWDWYTKDQSDTLLRALQVLSPLNVKQAFRGKSRWIKTFVYLWAQAWVYGHVYKLIRCELFGDEETNNLIESWGPEEKTMWEKHKVNSLDEIVETLNKNPIVAGGVNFITGGWVKALAGDCEEVDDKILQKLVAEGKMTDLQAQNVKDLGMKYFKAKGYDKYINLIEENIKDAKESIKKGGKENFRDVLGDTSWYDN